MPSISWRRTGMPGAARVCELPGRALTYFIPYLDRSTLEMKRGGLLGWPPRVVPGIGPRGRSPCGAASRESGRAPLPGAPHAASSAVVGMAGIRLQRFAAAATVVVCGCIALALTPAAIIPGSAGVAITIILLALQGLALAVPNVLIHLTRRLTVHHCGCSREVHYNIATGEAALRQRICAAFKDQATIEPAAIEGLEHPRGSGVVFPLSLVAAAVDSLLGSDCDLALLRPEPSVTRFRWADLQTKSSLGPEQLQTQQDFARCLAAKGYCMIRMPRERLDAPAAIFDEV